MAWQVEAARLTVQNRALQRMLKVPAGRHPATWLTARIVGDSGGSFVQALLLDAGTDQGVAVGMPAIAPEGWSGEWSTSAGEARACCWSPTSTRGSPWWSRARAITPILEGDNSLPPDAALPADEPRLRGRRSGPDLGSRRRSARRA